MTDSLAPNIAVVSSSGRFDMRTAARVERDALEAVRRGCDTVRVDLSRIETLAPGALGRLAQLQRALEKLRVGLELVDPDGRVSAAIPDGIVSTLRVVQAATRNGHPGRRRRRAPLEMAHCFAARPESIRAARTLLWRFSGQLDRVTLEAAQLALSELVTNAVLHSGTAEVDVRVTVADRLRVEVEDHGSWDFAAATSPRATDGGRGLQLVDAVSDRWGVDRRPNTVAWFEIAPV